MNHLVKLTTTGDRDNTSQVVSVPQGQAASAAITSPYMVGAGQMLDVEVEVMPVEGAARSLTAILEEAIQHGRDNPTHGANCTCLDRLVAELKDQIRSALPTFENEPDWEIRLDSRSRVKYLLRSASWLI